MHAVVKSVWCGIYRCWYKKIVISCYIEINIIDQLAKQYSSIFPSHMTISDRQVILDFDDDCRDSSLCERFYSLESRCLIDRQLQKVASSQKVSLSAVSSASVAWALYRSRWHPRLGFYNKFIFYVVNQNVSNRTSYVNFNCIIYKYIKTLRPLLKISIIMLVRHNTDICGGFNSLVNVYSTQLAIILCFTNKGYLILTK